METSSMPLATESFSYSWISSSTCNNNKSPAIVLDELLVRETSCSSSNGGTTLKEVCQNFNFDISVTNKSLDVLVHADELFSDGLIKPVFVEPSSKVDSCSSNTPDSSSQISTNNKPSPSFSSSSGVVVSPRTVETTTHHHYGFLRKWKTSTKRTLRSLFRYVSQLCKKFGCCSRKYCVRVDDIDNKKEWHQVKCWSSSKQASAKSITVHPISVFHDEHENSIYEAVLHCKRSIEK